jgi:hypothetical protein
MVSVFRAGFNQLNGFLLRNRRSFDDFAVALGLGKGLSALRKAAIAAVS